MFFTRWTFFQGITILLLIIFTFIAEIFKQEIGVSFSASDGINKPMLMTVLFYIVVMSLLSLLMYFQTKKSDTFLKHQLWEKMYIINPIILIISLIIVITFLLIEPLNDLVQNNRWIIYTLFYYILFLINATTLAIIHKVKKNNISNKNKIIYSFIWTSLGLFIVIIII